MAVNNERSMNNDLRLGMTDRGYFRIPPERGGQIEMEWPKVRAEQLMFGSWSEKGLALGLSAPGELCQDDVLRERISIVTGPTARTRPVAHNQFEANPFPTPLDAVHTSWPDSY